MSSDADYLHAALEQARLGRDAGEVPVGAVIVHEGRIIASAHNACIAQHDASAHAEMVALRQAGQYLRNYRLNECDMFITLEPCAMCAGALAHARIRRVVFGAFDVRAGAAGSKINVFADGGIPHAVLSICAQSDTNLPASLRGDLQKLLPDFFAERRAQQEAVRVPLRPDALRTPDACFEHLQLPGRSYYTNTLPSLQGLRLHYLRAGQEHAEAKWSQDAQHYVCLHSGQSWSAGFAAFIQQHRSDVVWAIDLIGFGLSDKPKKKQMHSLEWHAQIVLDWMEMLRGEGLQPGRMHLVVDDAAHPLLPHLSALAPGWFAHPLLLHPVDMSAELLSAAYPDAGHQQGPAYFAVLTKAFENNKK